jgi:pimeloyl-ACP methyl ester carboxylesterase
MTFRTMGGPYGCWGFPLPGFGFSWFGPGGPGPFERERWLRNLEEYQRDLEQTAADVADLIRRLREDVDTGATTQA